MRILGIETSCDETAASVVEDGTRLLSNVLASSVSFHRETGGIIPEIAAREQVRAIIPVINEALGEAAKTTSTYSKNTPSWEWGKKYLDAVAVTVGGPGLIGSLLVGVEVAKTLSWVWNKPLIPSVHMLAHLYAVWLSEPPYPHFPSIVLTVSGGHTDLLLMRGHGDFEFIGSTRDDTAGEAFDKIARYLGLSFPGGPAIEKIAQNVKSDTISLPRPLMTSGDFDFSFSGLKTAVLKVAKSSKSKAEIASSFQKAVVDVLVHKTLLSAKKFKAKSIVLAGGVAANQALRKQLREMSKIPVFIPPINLCTDNGAFIASYAFFNFNSRPWNKVKAEPDTSLAIGKYAKS